jgi:hypothetical protein
MLTILSPSTSTIFVGEPSQIQDFNIWHRLKEPKEAKQKVAWKKYGKYELKGRSAMKKESEKWGV